MKSKWYIISLLIYYVSQAAYFRFGINSPCEVSRAEMLTSLLYFGSVHALIIVQAIRIMRNSYELLEQVSVIVLLIFEGLFILYQVFLTIVPVEKFYSLINDINICFVLSLVCLISTISLLVCQITKK